MKKLYFFLSSFIIMSGTCKKDSDNCHHTIRVKNQSTKTIYIYGDNNYPDTLISPPRYAFPSPLSDPQLYEVKPNETNTEGLRLRRGCIESTFGTIIKSDTDIVYIFEKDVLESTPWDTIKAYNRYKKRYDLSLKDLQNNNFTITYP